MTIWLLSINSVYYYMKCNWRKMKGLTYNSCFSFRAKVADPVIEKMVVDILTPSNLSIAINALNSDETDTSMNRQCEMIYQWCRYKTNGGQRRVRNRL